MVETHTTVKDSKVEARAFHAGIGDNITIYGSNGEEGT